MENFGLKKKFTLLYYQYYDVATLAIIHKRNLPNLEAIDYWTIFLNENLIKLKLKAVLKFGGVLGVVGKPSPSQI